MLCVKICTVEPVIRGQRYIFQLLSEKGRCPPNRGVAMIPSIINTKQINIGSSRKLNECPLRPNIRVLTPI